MKRIHIILMIMAATGLFTSCSEEVFGGKDTWGRNVTLTIDYKQSLPEEITVTRATENATDPENALSNLQVFIFDEYGRLKGYKWITHDATAATTDENYLNQKGEIGEVKVKTTAGKCYIYGVANVPTALYSIDENIIPTSDPSASTDTKWKAKWDEDNVQAGNNELTLTQLKHIAFVRKAGEFDITESNFMMSGVTYGGELCEINDKGAITTGDNLIKLRRIVSKNTFNVIEGERVEFTPTSYEIWNIPAKEQLIDDTNINVEPSGFEQMTGSFSPQNTSSTEQTLKDKDDNDITDKAYTYSLKDIYLPENRQNANIQQAPSGGWTWLDREKDNGDKREDKKFTYAPLNSTYLVINGNYIGPRSKDKPFETVTGTTKYFVHLGNFSDKKSDFDVDRNCYYTYNIKLTGISSIEAEVIKEEENETGQDNGSAEGLVFDLSNGKVYDLDSHYGQVDMDFHQDDVTYDSKDGSYFIFLMVKDPFNDTGICKISSKDGNTFTITKGNTTETVSESTITSWFNWVEFVEGSDQSYSSLFTSSGGTYTKTKAMSLFDVLKALIKKRIASGSSEWSVTYTCFLNENYYEDKNWSQYVNKDQRYMYICRNLTNSHDQRNIRGAVIYGIRQYSIQTFYNTTYAGSVLAYGVEVNRDDNYGCKSSNIESNKKEISDNDTGWATSSTTSTWDGRQNLLSDKQANWNAAVYTVAKTACLSRNRDLNGNGKIDDDEIRWYCPTISQYAGLWIGEDALPLGGAKLMNGSTSDIKGDWNTRTDPAAHYYASGSSNRFYWAEEGMSTGSAYNEIISDGRVIKCVRTLQSGGKGLTSPTKYYTVENNTIDLKYVAISALRTIYQTAELTPHAERGSTGNDPAQKFVYASSNTNSTTTMSTLATAVTTDCSSYSQNDGYKWRAPNQRELCMMWITGVFDNSDTHVGCRTHMSVHDDTPKTSSMTSYSWEAWSNKVGMTNGSDVYIRCVRDHDDMNK